LRLAPTIRLQPCRGLGHWLRLAAIAPGVFVPGLLIRIDSAADSISRARGCDLRRNARVTRKALTCAEPTGAHRASADGHTVEACWRRARTR